jgi:ATP-binding cassette, subfamily F, member 3
VIVSHNRDFLDPVVTKTLEFRVGAPPRLFLGNLSYYLEKRAEERAQMQRLASAMPSAPSRNTEAGGGNSRERRRLESLRRQEQNRVLKPLREKLAKVEEDIAGLEAEKAALTARMGAEGFGEDAGAVLETTSRYATVDAALSRAYTQWSDVSEDVERAEREFADA